MLKNTATQYCDIDFSRISIIVKKKENSDFKYTSLKRLGAGFIFIMNGKGFFQYDDFSIDLKRGDVLTLDKGSIYEISSKSDDFEYATTEFYLNEDQSFEKATIPVYLSFGENLRFLEKVETLVTLWNDRAPYYFIETRMMLCDILIDIIKATVLEKKTVTGYGRIYPAIKYINKHYNDDCSIEELAKMCLFSPSYFRKLFFEYMGISPIKYRESIRCDIAKNMLSSNIFSVGEIGERLGYNDIYHFSKEFKKSTGFSPSQYKKKVFQNIE